MWQAGQKRYFFISLCLLCCLSASAPVWSSVGADAPLQDLSDQQLLTMLADNLTTLAGLQDRQLIELETAQAELRTAQEQSSEALRLSGEAQKLSTEAKNLAEQSKTSIGQASTSFESYKSEVQKEMDKLKNQNTWMKVGVVACLAIAAGALIWTAVNSVGGL